MHRHTRRGMTLAEVMIATTLLAVVVLIAMSAFAELLATTSSQTSLTRADQIANQALREIATQLRSAILPVQVGNGKRDENDPYYLIDNNTYGFGRKSWGADLAKGLDYVAFVHPVDAQGVNDFLDSENHLQLGQTRGEFMKDSSGNAFQEVVYLAATVTGTPGGDDFVYRSRPTELVNVLADISASDFTKGSENKKATDQDFSWWEGSRPSGADVTCFTAIRFVPVMNNDDPFTIEEADYGFDLDGDGKKDGVFEVGRLELVYSGSDDGTTFPYVHDGAVETASVQQVVVNLTQDVILRRKKNDSQYEPIFKLVTPNLAMSSTDDARPSAMRVRILVLDTEGIQIEQSDSSARLVFNKASRKVSARWYQTNVAMKNLDR